MTSQEPITKTLRGTLALTLALTGGALYDLIQLALERGVSTRSAAWMSGFALIGLVLLAELTALILTWTPLRDKMLAALGRLSRAVSLPAVIALGGSIVLLAAFLYMIFGRPHNFTTGLRGMLLWGFGLTLAALLYTRWRAQGWLPLLAASLLLLGAAYRFATYGIEITTYPFSLRWSETSRYFYASLFRAESLYGIQANPTVLHPTRYMMQSIPFLWSSAPLWLHRAWQVFLWMGTNSLAAWLLVRRVYTRGSSSRLTFFTAWLWAFLFLFQGPVWYHLVVVIIIVLWGFDSQNFWKSLVVVLAASVWAGMSRINWIPFPGVLAVVLFVLERDTEGQPFWRYLAQPVAWTLAGLGAGLAAQYGYAVWSGNALEQFGSSLTSDLLWYRLFPSGTYRLGVLPGILLATLPAVWLIEQRMRGRWKTIRPIRVLALAGALLVFFGGGLIVSTKIGGGNNLHNLDAYLAYLVVITAYVLASRVRPEAGTPSSGKFAPSRIALALTVAVPLYFTVSLGNPYKTANPQETQDAIALINERVQPIVARGGEVLFIAERQLIMFGDVPGVPMVAEYEKVFLMEMAMSGSLNYLNRLYDDLENKRFDLIVSVPHRVNFETAANSFGEENNAWVEHVSIPLLCYYDPSKFLRDVRVQFYVPRPEKQCPEGVTFERREP